jgi:hypothetical protein
MAVKRGNQKGKAAKQSKKVETVTTVDEETGGEAGFTITMDDLVAAADDLTECLDLEPALDTDLPEEDLKQLLVATVDLLTADDVAMARTFEPDTPVEERVDKNGGGPYLAVETLDVLEALGCELPKKKESKARVAGTGKPKKERGPKKATRADVFRDIVADGKPISREVLIQKMAENYGGSEKEAQFQCDIFTRLLITMGYMEKVGKDYQLLEPLK